MQFGIEAIAAIGSQGLGSTAASNGTPTRSFATLMEQSVGELNKDLTSAEGAMRDLAAGKPVELHDVMITLEQARISVQTFVQVRNKLIESYQDLMRMQL